MAIWRRAVATSGVCEGSLGHMTCMECAPPLVYVMTTASTCIPSCSRTSSLVVVPSLDTCACSTVDVDRTKSLSSTATAALGSSGTLCHDSSGCKIRYLHIYHAERLCSFKLQVHGASSLTFLAGLVQSAGKGDRVRKAYLWSFCMW